jgi:hypothetical protein
MKSVIVSGILKVVYGYVPGSRNPSFSKTAIWTTVHSGTGIICACLPVFWTLLVRLGKFKDWTWVHSLSNREKWHSFSSWSRRQPGSSRNDSVLAARNRVPIVGGEYELSLRSTAEGPFEGRTETERMHDGHYSPSPDIERRPSVSPIGRI